MIEGLKSENDEVKEAIQDMNEMIQQAENKAKQEADTTQSKNNTIINEFKTEIENRYQNISIQYQDSFDKAMAENQKLKEDLNKLRGDNDTLGEVVEKIQSTVNGMEVTTKEKFESNEKTIQEINSFTTNIKLQMEAEQENNLDIIKKDIDSLKSLIGDHEKDMGDRFSAYVIKFESEKQAMKDDIEKTAGDNFADIREDISILKGDVLGNNNNTNSLTERMTGLQHEIQNLDNRHADTVERMKEVTVLATNIDVYVKEQEEKQEKQKAEDTSAIISRIEKIDEELDLLKGRITEARDQAEKELSKEVKAINAKADDIDQRLGHLTNENKNNVQELVSLKEANFVQLEKAKDVEALTERVKVIDDERQKSEALLIQKNEELITLNRNAIKDLEKLHDDRLDNLEKENKAALENTAVTNMKISDIGSLQSDLGTKVLALEEASVQHFERAKYFETLNSRIGKIDEMRQQSEAKTRDELDAQISKNNAILHEHKIEFEKKFGSLNDENDRFKEALAILNDEEERLSKTISDIQKNLDSSEGSGKVMISRIDALETSQQLQDDCIEKLKSDFMKNYNEYNQNHKNMEKNLLMAQNNIQSIEKRIESDSKDMEERFNDSGICMADIKDTLNTLVENDQSKDITMNELNKSFEDSMNSLSLQIQTNLEVDHKVLLDRLKIAEENIQESKETINQNLVEVQKHDKSIIELKGTDQDHKEILENLRNDIIGLEKLLKAMSERQENANFSFTDKFETHEKQFDQIKKQISDLDDSVTGMSPDLNQNREKINVLQKVLNELEPKTQTLIGDISNLQEMEKMKTETIQGIKKDVDVLEKAFEEMQVKADVRNKTVDSQISSSIKTLDEVNSLTSNIMITLDADRESNMNSINEGMEKLDVKIQNCLSKVDSDRDESRKKYEDDLQGYLTKISEMEQRVIMLINESNDKHSQSLYKAQSEISENLLAIIKTLECKIDENKKEYDDEYKKMLESNSGKEEMMVQQIRQLETDFDTIFKDNSNAIISLEKSLELIKSSLSALSNNDAAKDKSMDDLRNSLEESIRVYSERFSNETNVLIERLQVTQAEVEVLKDSNLSNYETVKKNSAGLDDLSAKVVIERQNIINLGDKLTAMQSKEEISKDETIKSMAVLTDKLDDESNKIKELKKQVDDLDDSVTELSPQINKNLQKIVNLEGCFENLEPITQNLQKDVHSLIGDGKKFEKSLQEVKDNADRFGKLMEAFKEQIENLISKSNETSEANEITFKKIQGKVSEIQTTVDKQLDNAKDQVNIMINDINISLESQKKYIEEKMQNYIKDVEDHMKQFNDSVEKDNELELMKLKESIQSMLSQSNESFTQRFNEVSIKLEASEISIGEHISTIEASLSNFGTDLESLSNLCKNHEADLIGMKEENFVQQEKVKNVEAMTARVDNERQKTEAQMIERNENMILKNAQAIRDLQEDYEAKLQNVILDVRPELDHIKNESEKFIVKLDDLKSSNERLKNNFDDSEKQQNELQVTLNNQTSELVMLKKMFDQNNESITDHESKLVVLQGLIARIDKIDEMRQKGESQSKADMEQIVQGIKENIDQYQADMNISLDDIKSKHFKADAATQDAMREMKDNLIVLKSEGVSFKETLSKYQELLESKLKEVDLSTKENTRDISSLREILKDTSDKFDMAQKGVKDRLESIVAEVPKTVEKSMDIFRSDIKEDMTTMLDDLKLFKGKVEPLELQVNRIELDFNDRYRKQSDDIIELKNVSQDMHFALKNEYDGKLKDMSDLFDKYGKDSEINRNFIQSSQEMFNTLTIGNARQDERISSLESLSQVMDNKLGSLESADLFLQEAHRMLTDKTTTVESESKKLENTVMSSLRNQREDLEMTLKKQITMLLKDIEDVNSSIARNDEAIEKLDVQSSDNQDKIQSLEESFGKQNLESNNALKIAVSNLEKTYSKKIGDLELKVNQNSEHVEENIQNIENNSGSINTILDEIEIFRTKLESLDIAREKNDKSLEDHKEEMISLCQTTTKNMSNMISESDGRFDKVVKGLMVSINALEENETNLSNKITNTYGDLQASIETLREDFKEGEIKTQSSCTAINNRLQETGIKIEEMHVRLADIDSKHGYFSEQLKETNQLAKNLEVLIKNQELKFDEQKDKDIAGFEERFLSLEKINNTLSAEMSTLQQGCESTLSRLEHLEISFDSQAKRNNEIREDMLTQVSANRTNISAHETHIHEILEQIRIFNERNRLHAEKLHLLEMLSDRVDQLDEARAKDDVRWTTALESLSDHYSKELERMKVEAESMYITINSQEFTSLVKSSSELRRELSELIQKNTTIFHSLDALSEKDNDLNILLSNNCTKLKENIVQNQKSMSELRQMIENLTEDNNYNKEKLISIEEAYHIQGEKANYVESMVGKMDEMRQQSEAKSKEELSESVQSNYKAIESLRIEIEKKMTSIFEQLTKEIHIVKTSQETLGSSMHEDQQKALNNLGQEQESKIIAIMKIIEEHKTLIEKTHTSVTKITERVVHNESVQNNSQEIFVQENAARIKQLQDILEKQISSLLSQNAEQQTMIVSNMEDITESKQHWNSLFAGVKRDMASMQDTQEEERKLIVSRVQENTNTLEAFFASLGTRVEKIETAQIQETSRLETVERHFVDRTERDEQLLARLTGLERVTSEHQTLIHNLDKSVRQKVEEFDIDFQDYKKSSKEELRSIRTAMRTDKENLWELIIEIYSAFRGSTLVLKSEGAVKHHQADVLGVYRMVDSYNDRPVYKQDQGENYIYYSATSNSWLVGTVVGHQYGWLRNPSENAGKRRWIPDLRTGWEYRPLVRGNDLGNGWCTDDGTLRIESLKDVEKVNELIRDIKNSTEVD